MILKFKLIVSFCVVILLDSTLSFPSNNEDSSEDVVIPSVDITKDSNKTLIAILSPKKDSEENISPYLDNSENKTVVIIAGDVEEIKDIPKLLNDFKEKQVALEQKKFNAFKDDLMSVLNDFKVDLLSDMKKALKNHDSKNEKEQLSKITNIVSYNMTSCNRKPVAVESFFKKGRDCLIVNRRFSENFYPEVSDFAKDSYRRRVFNNMGKNWLSYNYNDYFKWSLERYQVGKEFVYKIKSQKFDEYLYASSKDLQDDPHRRDVYTWRSKAKCDEQCYWDIQLVQHDNSTQEKYFSIRNTEFDEYLFAMDIDLDETVRRNIFTWKFDPNQDVICNTHWTIECK